MAPLYYHGKVWYSLLTSLRWVLLYLYGFCILLHLRNQRAISLGLSLEQVDELYAKVPNAWQSKGFVPTVKFVDVREMGASDARRATLAELEQAAVKRKSSAGIHQEVLREKY